MMVGLAGGPFHAFALALAAVGFLVEYAAWTAGFGAALMGAFGRRPPPTGGELSGTPAPSAPPPEETESHPTATHA